MMETLYNAPHRAPPRSSCEAPALSSLCRYIGFEAAEGWLFSNDPVKTLGRAEVEHSIRCISTSMFPARPGPLSLSQLIAWRKDFLLVPTGRIQSQEGGYMIGTVLGDATSGVFGIGKAEAVIRFAISEERGDALFISWVKDTWSKDEEEELEEQSKKSNKSQKRKRAKTNNMQGSARSPNANKGQVTPAGANNDQFASLYPRPDAKWRYAVVTYITVVDLCHRQREMILFDLKEGGGVHRTRAKQRIATIEVRNCPLCYSAAGVCFCSKLKNVMLPPRTYRQSNQEMVELQRTDVSRKYQIDGEDPQMPFASAGLPRLYALLSGVYQGNVQMFEFARDKPDEMIKSFSTHVVSSGELGNEKLRMKQRLVNDFVRENYNPARGAGVGRKMLKDVMQVLDDKRIEEEQKKREGPSQGDIDFLMNKPNKAVDAYGPIYHSPVGITEVQNTIMPTSPPDAGRSRLRKLQPRDGSGAGPVVHKISKEKMRVLRNRERAQISNERRRARLKSMELQLSNSKATVGLLLEMTLALHKENNQLREQMQNNGMEPTSAQNDIGLVLNSDTHSPAEEEHAGSSTATPASDPVFISEAERNSKEPLNDKVK